MFSYGTTLNVSAPLVHGAGNGTRTRYLHLGKVALYQMSYARRDNDYYNKIRKIVKGFFIFFFSQR